MRYRLFATLKMINAAGILAAAFKEEGGRVRVWVGDAEAGVRASDTFASLEKAEAWLQATAVELYPGSTYAKMKRFLADAEAQARSQTS